MINRHPWQPLFISISSLILLMFVFLFFFFPSLIFPTDRLAITNTPPSIGIPEKYVSAPGLIEIIVYSPNISKQDIFSIATKYNAQIVLANERLNIYELYLPLDPTAIHTQRVADEINQNWRPHLRATISTELINE